MIQYIISLYSQLILSIIHLINDTFKSLDKCNIEFIS